jgi:hypothetical protein
MKNITTREFINVKERIDDLNLSHPSSLAFLPKNFEDAEDKQSLIYNSSVSTLRKIFNQERIDVSTIEDKDLKIPELQQNAFELVGPIIFISASYYSQNPDAVNIALGLISSYLKDFFKGIPGNKKVKLSIVKEETKGKKYQRIDYEGDVSGLSELGDIIKSTKNE